MPVSPLRADIAKAQREFYTHSLLGFTAELRALGGDADNTALDHLLRDMGKPSATAKEKIRPANFHQAARMFMVAASNFLKARQDAAEEANPDLRFLQVVDLELGELLEAMKFFARSAHVDVQSHVQEVMQRAEIMAAIVRSNDVLPYEQAERAVEAAAGRS